MSRGQRILVLAVVLLAVLACAAEARRSRRLRSRANRRSDFDFFFLVRQWPATFCNDHQCTHRPPKRYAFTLHGMWPQRRDGTWPEYCDPSSHLDVDNIDDLVDEMERDWPSWSSTDETFWDHEWNRHGTCAAPVTGGQHRFFRTVLSLHHRLNIEGALRAGGIRPSNSRRYPVQDIKDAIERVHGVMPHVTCDANGELSEVWMCVNKRLRPIDCVEDPRPHNSNRNKRRAAAAAAAAAAGSASNGAVAAVDAQEAGEEVTSAPVPPNYNCNMVTIPKLRRGHKGRKAGKHTEQEGLFKAEEHEDDDDEEVEFGMDVVAESGKVVSDSVAAVAAAAAAIEPTSSLETAVDNAVQAVQEVVSSAMAAVDSSVDEDTLPASSLTAAAQQAVTAAAAVAAVIEEELTASGVVAVAEVTAANAEQQQQVAQEPAAASSTTTTTTAATTASDDAGAASQVVTPDSMVPWPTSTSTTNQHLPVLAGVVMGVVAAAVVAAGVVLRASLPDSSSSSSCKAQHVKYCYVPPVATTCSNDSPAAAGPAESCPLLATAGTADGV